MNATIQYLQKLGYAPTDFSNVVHESGHASLPEDLNAAPAGGSGVPREAAPKPGGSVDASAPGGLARNSATEPAGETPKTNEKLSAEGARFRKNIQSMLAGR